MSKNIATEIEEIIRTRKISARQELKFEMQEELKKFPDKKKKLIEYSGVPEKELADFFDGLWITGRNVDTIIKFYEYTMEDEEKPFDYTSYQSKYKDLGDNYIEFLDVILDANEYPKVS